MAHLNLTTGTEAVTAGGFGKDTPRRIEYLPNGLWRIDWASGIVTTQHTDPRATA